MSKKRTFFSRPLVRYILLGILLLGIIILATLVGATPVPINNLLQSPIVWQLRIPRILAAILTGAALSVCGATYQSIFRNPLTDPYLLGISSGASLGAAIAIVCGLQSTRYGICLCALISALLTVWLIYRIATQHGRLHITTLLLTGVCLTLLVSAAVSLLMVLHNDKMDSIIFWTMGSFATVSYTDILILLPITIAGIAIVRYNAKNLNLLLSGNDQAKSMGVEVEKVQKTLLGVTTLMVAFAVACCGVIGFIGLIVPHAVRLLTGADNRQVIPTTMLAGALFMLLCDTAARTLFLPSELPVGSITALIGAPLFIILLLKNNTSC